MGLFWVKNTQAYLLTFYLKKNTINIKSYVVIYNISVVLLQRKYNYLSFFIRLIYGKDL
jgi:hypothetical protein